MKKEAYPSLEVAHPTAKATPIRNWPAHHHISVDGMPEDHFIQRDGIVYAGSHLIIDFWGARRLDDLQLMESALRDCVRKSQATLLHIHLHHFTPSGGISGVAVLAESHISVHSWPEREYAAFDVFMCGNAKPEESISVLMRAFTPRRINVTECLRGVLADE